MRFVLNCLIYMHSDYYTTNAMHTYHYPDLMDAAASLFYVPN